MAASTSTPSTSNVPPPNIPVAPSTWHTKCQMYWIAVRFPNPLPVDTYGPLESPYLTPEDNQVSGFPSVGLVMLVRYSETPLGKYDELAIIPGEFDLRALVKEVSELKDERDHILEAFLKGKKKHMRITRIYVSQLATCWNGRHIWNVPKHLAAFDIHDSSTSVTAHVYPPISATDPTRLPNAKPFFSARFTKIPYLPSFPFSAKALTSLGMSDLLVQPPIPSHPDIGLLCGNEHWKRLQLGFRSTKGTSLCWVEVGKDVTERKEAGEGDSLLGKKQTKGSSRSEEGALEDCECRGWWPDTAKLAWRIGLWVGESEMMIDQTQDLAHNSSSTSSHRKNMSHL